MKILFVAPDLYGYGGVQLFCRLALKSLCDTYSEKDEITLVSRNDTIESIRKGGFTCPAYAAAGSMMTFAGYVLRLMYSRNWDAVIVMHANISRILPFCPKQRTMVVFHGIDVWKTLSFMYKAGLNRCDRVVSISSHTIKQAIAFNPWLAKIPSSVCYLGVPNESDPPQSDPPESGPYLLSIGRMVGDERYKGFSELIHAWPRISKERPELKLILMGDGPDRKRLEQLSERISANVSFLGRVDDVTRDRYLRHCTAFALPSRGEGFGLVYLEAMRVGRPVLTGHSDAGAEVILDGVTGRAVNPVDMDQLVEGVLDVTGQNAQRYGQAGQNRFKENFTYEHFRDRFIREVRTLIEMR